MIEAKHNFFVNTFFKIYTNFKLKFCFEKIIINNQSVTKDKPVLLISNHFSWWDGFWSFYINNKIFKKNFYFMMLEEQLKKHLFFTKTGGFSVNKNSRSIIESLNYAAEKLKDNNNLLLIFPQGEFQTINKNDFVFEKGIEKILNQLENKIHIVFMANLIDYYSKPKPTLFIYLKNYNSDLCSKKDIENQYNSFYKQCCLVNNSFKNTL